MITSGLGSRAKLFRGLGDLSRLRVLEVLRDGPLSAGDIAVRAGLSQPNASMHLACLAECGLVNRERQGRFVHYEVADKGVVMLLDQAEDLLLQVGPLIDACPRYRRPGRESRRGGTTTAGWVAAAPREETDCAMTRRGSVGFSSPPSGAGAGRKPITGYYRSWCNTLALFYDALTRVLSLFVGGERRFRERIIDAANLEDGDKVLDVGCGTGTLAILMARRVGARGEVVGIDLSPRMLARARGKAVDVPSLTFQLGNAEDLPFPDGAFDVVTMTYVLHEMPHAARQNALREARRVLKPNGRLIVMEPYEPKGRVRRVAFKLLMLWENETAWDLLGRGLHSELVQAGFQEIRTQFLHRDLLPLIVALNPRRSSQELCEAPEACSCDDELSPIELHAEGQREERHPVERHSAGEVEDDLASRPDRGESGLSPSDGSGAAFPGRPQ